MRGCGDEDKNSPLRLVRSNTTQGAAETSSADAAGYIYPITEVSGGATIFPGKDVEAMKLFSSKQGKGVWIGGGATRPWDGAPSEGPVERERHHYAPPDKRCFDCKVPGGCDKRHPLCALKQKSRESAQERRETFLRLYAEGKSDGQISREMGLSRSTIAGRRKRLGLEPNGKKKGMV